MEPVKRFSQQMLRVLRSPRFFYAVLAFFGCEALWYVCSAAFPMAFDEGFHLGVIQLYADQWSPILTHQPDGPAPFGALTTDPSYLYHYLMSFPYRLVALVTSNEAAQVIVLRLINVGLFAWGIVLYRRLLGVAKVSPALTHTILALFVLVPAVPLLAAHINYDNLFFVVVALIGIVVFRITEGLRQREVRIVSWMLLLVLVMALTLVKYAGLPVVLGTLLYLLVVVWRTYRGQWRQCLPQVRAGWRPLSKRAKVMLVGLVLLMSALFVQRYGVNLYRYHTPVPDCDAVISIERCRAYGPFGRNDRMHRENSLEFNNSAVDYTGTWFRGMWYRLFFAINGPLPQAYYLNYRPLPLPSVTAVVLATASLLLFIWYAAHVFKQRPLLAYFAVVCFVYALILWIDNYTQFLYTRQPVAINGRYFIPFLPLMAAVAGRAWSVALRRRVAWKPWLAVAAILLFLQGGGVMTFILRSDHDWDWPNQSVYWVNDRARDMLKPLIVEGSPPYK